MHFLCGGTYVYVKLTLQQAMKTQRWSRGIVLHSGIPSNFVQGGQQIQLRTEGRKNRDLGVIDP
jgi:hypothetical protein